MLLTTQDFVKACKRDLYNEGILEKLLASNLQRATK